MRIYTRTGDKGMTSLFNGSRVEKNSQRIDLLGDIDELNAQIGLLISLLDDKSISLFLKKVQEILFEGGSEIANPGIIDFVDYSKQSEVLEKSMDEMDKNLDELHNFILPGGIQTASYSHLCRTKTRTVERKFFLVAKENTLNSSFGMYLNRLSDYFFVLARFLNKTGGEKDNIWMGNTKK